MTKLLTILCFGFASCQQVEKTKESPPLKSEVNDSLNMGTAADAAKRYSLDEMYQQYVSEELLLYMDKAHPTWSIPNVNQWYPQLFNKYKTNNSLANYVSGDFDCNGAVDEALIVDNGNHVLTAVAFLRIDGSFKTIQLSEVGYDEGDKINYVLRLYKPGRYNISDPDLGPSDQKYVNLTCTSVGIGMFKELYEGGNDVYYWEEGNLRSCVIEK